MSKVSSVAIIGAGNVGCALAADLARSSISVNLCGHPVHSNNINRIKQNNNEITLSGAIDSRSKINILTNDLYTATNGIKYIFITLPSYAQEGLFKELLPILVDGQVLISLNGNFSTLAYIKELFESDFRDKNLLFVESNTSPYACRFEKTGIVSIYGKKSSLSFASYPSNISSSVKNELAVLMAAKLTWKNTILDVGFDAVNGVIHPATAILNTGWIETTGGDFYFYKEGMSRSVSKVLDKVELERKHICEQYGIKFVSFIEGVRDHYGVKYRDIHDFAYNSPPHNMIKGSPSCMTHRYVIEDIQYILVPWLGFSNIAKVQSETISSIINIASIINETDHIIEGRNSKKLGIDEMSIAELIRYVKGER